MVPRKGFEPSTLRVWTACSSQLSYLGIWWREPDLNQRPSGYEPDELPDYSIPRQYFLDNSFKVVPRAGLEPARKKIPQDFKSCASTDFATKAQKFIIFNTD